MRHVPSDGAPRRFRSPDRRTLRASHQFDAGLLQTRRSDRISCAPRAACRDHDANYKCHRHLLCGCWCSCDHPPRAPPRFTGLKGPSFAVATTCTTSLLAAHVFKPHPPTKRAADLCHRPAVSLIALLPAPSAAAVFASRSPESQRAGCSFKVSQREPPQRDGQTQLPVVVAQRPLLHSASARHPLVLLSWPGKMYKRRARHLEQG